MTSSRTRTKPVASSSRKVPEALCTKKATPRIGSWHQKRCSVAASLGFRATLIKWCTYKITKDIQSSTNWWLIIIFTKQQVTAIIIITMTHRHDCSFRRPHTEALQQRLGKNLPKYAAASILALLEASQKVTMDRGVAFKAESTSTLPPPSPGFQAQMKV